MIEADGIHIHAYPERTAEYTAIVDGFLARVAPAFAR